MRDGMACCWMLEVPGGRIVGVYVNRKHAGSVDKFGQQRKARSAPPFRNYFVRVHLHNISQTLASEVPIGDDGDVSVHIADLPRLGDPLIGKILLANLFRDEMAAEYVLTKRRTDLEGVPDHRLRSLDDGLPTGDRDCCA
jgi:hypothetical protein